jgi:dihydroorotase
MPRYPRVVIGRLATPTGLERRAIGIDTTTGRIAAVAARLDGDEVVDHGERVILPGAVDIHVHFRDPGHPAKEDFASGTRAALHGGVTTVMDMPNTDPATTTRARYEEKRALVAPKAHCDFALWGGATAPGADARAVAAVAPGLKLYLGESTGKVTFEEPDQLERLIADLQEVRFPGVLAVHAEQQADLEAARDKHATAPGLRGHGARRPPAAELAALQGLADAIRGVAARPEALSFRVHVAHASTFALLESARALGLSVGVTPHHLFLHDALPLGAYGRVNPPLRDEKEAARLYAALRAGLVPIVESDHAPHTRAEKGRDVLDAPSGMPGVETLLPLLAARAARGELSWHTVAATTATAPARLFALPKGEIAPGRDADLVVVDPADAAPLSEERLLTRCGWTAFAGHPAILPRTVYLRGEPVVEDGMVVARPGTGQEAPPVPRA